LQVTGDARVRYLSEASMCSPAIVTGLGGHVIEDGAETLAATSAAFSIQGANLKTAAVVCDGTSDITGDAQSLLVGAIETHGSCDAHADTQVVCAADGGVLAWDGFVHNGNRTARSLPWINGSAFGAHPKIIHGINNLRTELLETTKAVKFQRGC
jgi:hypothetical protein